MWFLVSIIGWLHSVVLLEYPTKCELFSWVLRQVRAMRRAINAKKWHLAGYSTAKQKLRAITIN